MAEQRLEQIADARALAAPDAAARVDASPPPGINGSDTGLQARYAAALQEAIHEARDAAWSFAGCLAARSSAPRCHRHVPTMNRGGDRSKQPC